jgi:hypothetical protein
MELTAGSGRTTERIVWTQWGKPAHIAAPSSSTAIGKV